MRLKYIHEFQLFTELCWVVGQFEQLAQYKVIHKLLNYYFVNANPEK